MNQNSERVPSPVGMGSLVLLACLVVGALASLKGPSIPQQLVFLSSEWAKRPGTVLTYPFVDIDFPHSLVSIVFLAIFGCEVEGATGTGRFLGVWLVATLLFALGSTAAFGIAKFPGIATGGWIPVAAVILTWCLIRPVGRLPQVSVTVATCIGTITVLALYYYFGKSMPSLGVAALVASAGGAALGRQTTR